MIKDTGYALLKKKVLTTEALIDHLQSVALLTHINLTAKCKNLKKDYVSIFKVIRAAAAADVANDPRPFDMVRFNVHKKNFDTTLLATNLQEIKPPLSVTGTLRTMVTAPAAAPIVRLPIARPSRSQGAATGPSITCFHCNKPDYAVPNCPTKKTLVSLQLVEKRKTTYILARDTRRTVRSAENTERAESALLTRSEPIPPIQYDTDTDNEQDEDDDNDD
jgi:hypothetical protein